MTEFPGYLPWHIGGDPWFTYGEIEALQLAVKQRAEAARKRAREARAARSGRLSRRPRRG